MNEAPVCAADVKAFVYGEGSNACLPVGLADSEAGDSTVFIGDSPVTKMADICQMQQGSEHDTGPLMQGNGTVFVGQFPLSGKGHVAKGDAKSLLCAVQKVATDVLMSDTTVEMIADGGDAGAKAEEENRLDRMRKEQGEQTDKARAQNAHDQYQAESAKARADAEAVKLDQKTSAASNAPQGDSIKDVGQHMKDVNDANSQSLQSQLADADAANTATKAESAAAHMAEEEAKLAKISKGTLAKFAGDMFGLIDAGINIYKLAPILTGQQMSRQQEGEILGEAMGDVAAGLAVVGILALGTVTMTAGGVVIVVVAGAIVAKGMGDLGKEALGRVGEQADKARASRAGVPPAALGPEVHQMQDVTMCFVAGTHVLTPAGSRPIELLRPGDAVMSMSLEHSVLRVSLVTRVFEGNSDRLVTLKLSDGSTVETTPEHRFRTAASEWRPAKEIRKGVALVKADGASVLVLSRRTRRQVNRVYNISVAAHRNYFAGDASVLSHNMSLRLGKKTH